MTVKTREEIRAALSELEKGVDFDTIEKEELVELYLKRDEIFELDPVSTIEKHIKKIGGDYLRRHRVLNKITNLRHFYNACSVSELFLLGW